MIIIDSDIYTNYFITDGLDVIEVKLVNIDYQTNGEIYTFCHLNDNTVITLHSLELSDKVFKNRINAEAFVKKSAHKAYMHKIQNAPSYDDFIQYIEQFIYNYTNPYASEEAIEELDDIFNELKNKS